MECPVCRINNISGIKYCINCGINLENSQEISYGDIDRGGYHTEEEYLSENKSFEISDGVFTINDRHSPYIPEDLFTSEDFGRQTETSPVEEFDFGGQTEASPVEEYDFGGQTETSPVEECDFGGQTKTSTVEEFDFGGQSETITFEEFDFVEQTETSPVEEYDFGGQTETSPVEEYDFGGQTETSPVEEYDFGGQTETSPIEEYDFGGQVENITSDNSVSFNDEPLVSKPYSDYSNSSVPLPAPPYNDMYGSSPQIIGYEQNGMPIYGQPQVYPQPQIIGYDQNGMPVYGQPQVYPQPQIVGYDQNGMPVYGQPQVCPQPQIIGYDQNGMPVYGQPYVYPQNSVPVISQSVPAEPPADDYAEKFMDFLEDGENNNTRNTKEDFFRKSSDMGDVSLQTPDFSSLKKREQKKKVYMTDVEIQDAENLIPNDVNKFNRKYMRQAGNSNSNDLGEKNPYGRKVSMGRTKDVDAGMLSPKLSAKSRIRMSDAGTADSDTLETYTPERKKKFAMEEAVHAVEAMPKKKRYVDELDLIELPDYMQARKKPKKDEKNFPSMTDL